MTSPQIKILILTAVGASVYLFVIELCRNRQIARLIRWTRETWSEQWAALPWTLRRFNHVGALVRLRRTGAVDDPEFLQRLHDTRPLQRHQVIAFATAAVSLLLVLAGLRWWGWQW